MVRCRGVRAVPLYLVVNPLRPTPSPFPRSLREGLEGRRVPYPPTRLGPSEYGIQNLTIEYVIESLRWTPQALKGLVTVSLCAHSWSSVEYQRATTVCGLSAAVTVGIHWVLKVRKVAEALRKKSVVNLKLVGHNNQYVMNVLL
eukprot:comp22645_c0_seq1/m.34896 comp22645_c0_seq1/g.34896  ORF comp22645_c0_seq1/g.34896 comp22645_c0_seq1/m.34896 type:complete len:144 (-) comp22645_c0_seq1:368-799(-)